jgi:hypothetical protein
MEVNEKGIKEGGSINRFKLLEKLEEGATGIVWFVFDPQYSNKYWIIKNYFLTDKI